MSFLSSPALRACPAYFPAALCPRPRRTLPRWLVAPAFAMAPALRACPARFPAALCPGGLSPPLLPWPPPFSLHLFGKRAIFPPTEKRKNAAFLVCNSESFSSRPNFWVCIVKGGGFQDRGKRFGTGAKRFRTGERGSAPGRRGLAPGEEVQDRGEEVQRSSRLSIFLR